MLVDYLVVFSNMDDFVLSCSGGWTHTAKALNLVKNDIFLPAQSRYGDDKEADVSNIMILLTDGESNDNDKTALPRVVRELKRDIKGICQVPFMLFSFIQHLLIVSNVADLTMISVGVGKKINKDELEMIATDPSKHVFTADDFTALLRLVKKLQQRTCTSKEIAYY